LCRGANVRRRENDFCDAQMYIQPGAAGVSPPWCSGNAPATPILHTFGYTRLVRKQERRASARRGVANRVCNGNAPDFRNRVRIPRTYHGGLTPPALVLVYGRPPARKRFLRCTNARRKERRASARRGVRETHLQHRYSTRSGTLVSCGNKSGGRQPAVGVQTASAMAMHGISRFELACGLTPRGAYAPRSCVAARTSAGEKTIFAMHKRTPKRAAGVSPPWIGEPDALPRNSNIV